MFVVKQVSPEQMKKYRFWLGMSQEAIAEAFGVHLETYSRWERGAKEPESPKLVALAFESLLNRRLTAEAEKGRIGQMKELREQTEFYLNEIEKLDKLGRSRYRAPVRLKS